MRIEAAASQICFGLGFLFFGFGAAVRNAIGGSLGFRLGPRLRFARALQVYDLVHVAVCRADTAPLEAFQALEPQGFFSDAQTLHFLMQGTIGVEREACSALCLDGLGLSQESVAHAEGRRRDLC